MFVHAAAMLLLLSGAVWLVTKYQPSGGTATGGGGGAGGGGTGNATLQVQAGGGQ